MRQIVLDTETTGLDPKDGHRIIEIGCVELVNYMPTGKVYQTYINPERDVPWEATRVSGIKTDFLKPYPVFEKIIDDFLGFIENTELVIHNAAFDMKFLNAEITRLKRPPLPAHRALDTLLLARKKFPGSPASLDALCRRFNIDLSKRTKHGALLDCELLAKVYLELMGGRQISMELAAQSANGGGNGEDGQSSGDKNSDGSLRVSSKKPYREPRPLSLSDEEKEAHAALLKDIKNPLWG